MATSVRIDGALPALGANPTITTVFSGGWAVDYDWAADRAVNGGQPRRLRTLGFPAPFDADLEGALRGQGRFADFTYLFAGGQYQRIRHATMTPEGAPSTTAPAWDLPADWTSFDAVFPGGGKKHQFAYFFRGDEYCRFDWTTDKRSPGYPRKIGPNWHTSPPFTSRIDGAIVGAGAFATKAYLFTTLTVTVDDAGNPAAGHTVAVPAYARYDFDSETVDFTLTDPAELVRRWPGLFPLLDAGTATDAALAWIDHAQGALATSPLAAPTATAFGHHFMTGTPDATTVSTVNGRFGELHKRIDAVPDRFVWTPNLAFPAQTAQGTQTEVGNEFSTFHGPNGRAAVLIHEAVHFTFGTDVDVPEWSGQTVNGNFHPAPAGTPVYSSISQADALVNPSSYAAFAQEIAFGSDTRFGAARPQQ